MPQPTDEELYETHLMIHKVWTSQVGTEGYIKDDWKRLERLVNRLIDVSCGTLTTGGWLAKIEGRLGPEKMRSVQERVRPAQGIENASKEPVLVTIEPMMVGEDPSIEIYHVEISDGKGIWTETFGSSELLKAFLQGAQAAFVTVHIPHKIEWKPIKKEPVK